MKRELLEKYLNKMVRLTMYDNVILQGCLRKTNDEMFKHDLNLYLPKKRYFLTEDSESKICISYQFKTSYVKKLEEIKRC